MVTFRPAKTWRFNGKSIDLGKPRVLSVANITPDSFFAGSRIVGDPRLIGEALKGLVEENPDIIDVGGQSTRPGSERIGAGEELKRVVPVVRRLRELDPYVAISVDTYHSSVAREALQAGADIVNDVSAGRYDPEIIGVTAEAGAGYVLMHMLGTPETMQRSPYYDDCVEEILGFMARRLDEIEALGLPRKRIALDPGIGFGKRLVDNIELIRHAGRFHELGLPVLYGVSRKSFIGMASGEQDPEHRLAGTLGITWHLLDQGVMLHRMHDVRETKQLFSLWETVNKI